MTDQTEWDLWLSGAPWSEVARIQRPLPDRLIVVPAPAKPPA
jgi:hypothetical protein